MAIKISRVIESKLRFLKLTKAGKIRLNVFSDKILYEAITAVRLIDHEVDNPFNTFFAACLLKTQLAGLEPNWEQMDTLTYSDGYDSKGPVTLENEMFDMKECCDIMKNKSDLFTKKSYSKQSHSFGGNSHNTYAKGLQYFKHGTWHPYPDQAVDEDFRPAAPADSKCTQNCGACHANSGKKIDRSNIVPEEELKKAIRSGKMNMQGLAFLRSSFLHKPELLTLIDNALEGNISPDDSQANFVKD